MRRIALVACALLGMIASAALAGPAGAEPAVGVIKGTKILAGFDTSHPGTFTSLRQINGLTPPEALVDVDFRYHPNGTLSPLPQPQLFGLAVVGGLEYKVRLYTIDLETGTATPLGPAFGVTPGGNNFGIDFNPTADRIRGVNDFDANFRINPGNGARADSPTSDTQLSPAGSKVSGVAYDRVDIPIPPLVPANTTAYAIGTNPSSLYTIGGLNSAPSPNGGALDNAKPLGVTLTPNAPVGFDIDRSGTAYASLVVGGEPGLYTVNLSSGAATLVGKQPETLSGMAIVPETVPVPPADTAAPTVALTGVKASMSLPALLKGVTVKASPSEPAALDGVLLAAAKSARLASFNLTLASKSLKLAAGQRTLKLKPSKRLVGHPDKTFRVRLQVTATDAAGNAKVVTKTIKVKPAPRRRG